MRKPHLIIVIVRLNCFFSDIDFEYPSNTAQGQGFADLLTELRASFDDLAVNNGDSVPYQITV